MTTEVKTLEAIDDLWPEKFLEFPKNKSTFSNPNFIVKFFTNFVVEVNENADYLLQNEDLQLTDEFEDIQDFGPLVPLYLRSASILRKVNQHSLTLMDFYIPNGKKMYNLVYVAIHFVIYLNNSLDTISEIVNEYLKKASEIEELKDSIETLLSKNAETAESIGRVISKTEDLKNDLVETKKSYQKMLEKKTLQESVFAKKKTEVQILETEIDNLEYQLSLLEDSERELLVSRVTEDEYKTLHQTEAYLKDEYQQLLTNCDAGNYADRGFEDVNTYEAFALQLSNLRNDNLGKIVTNLHEQKLEMKDQLQILNDCNEELKVQKTVTEDCQKNDEHLLKVLKEMTDFSEQEHTKILKEQEEEEKLRVAKCLKASACIEEQHRLETEIESLKAAIQETKSNTEDMYRIATKKYQKILKTQSQATEKFQEMFMHLKKGSEEVKRRMT